LLLYLDGADGSVAVPAEQVHARKVDAGFEEILVACAPGPVT
jgi:hypothetical protein